MKEYKKSYNLREARPRSKRLRELGAVKSSTASGNFDDSSLQSRLAALEDLFEIVDGRVHVKNGRSLYTDGTFASLGMDEGGEGGGSLVQWEQTYVPTDLSLAEQIAVVTINGQETQVFAPKGGGGGSLAALSDTEVTSPSGDHILVYKDGKWKNMHILTAVRPFVLSDEGGVIDGGALNIRGPYGELLMNYRPITFVDCYMREEDGSKLAIYADGGVNFVTDGSVTINGAPIGTGGGGSGSTVQWQQLVTSGTKIATIKINGATTNVYAPSGGSSESLELNDLANVSAGSPDAGDVLYWNGVRWINYPSSNFGGGGGGGSYTLPLANNGTRGGVQTGYTSTDRLKVGVQLSAEKMYVSLPKRYVGTTEVQLDPNQQSLAGLINVTMSGALTAGSASILGDLSTTNATIKGSLIIGSAKLIYRDGALQVYKQDGSNCSLFASGTFSSGGN